MDIVFYAIFLVVSFGLGILATVDRIFGIAGTMIGFLGIGILATDQTITIRSFYDPNLTIIVNENVNFYPYVFILVVVIMLDVVILIAASDRFAKQEEE